MKDLTKGSIAKHVVSMAAPICVGMFAQIGYQLIDLYFVTQLGVTATAGVNAASNIIFIVTALTQVLSAGTAALIAHAVGRKDQTDANMVFNQSLALSTACSIVTMALLAMFAAPYLRWIAADEATVQAGLVFTFSVLPGYAIMFPWTALGAALRGTGIVQPPIAIYVVTLLINAALAPVLIAGWGTGIALGVQGAGLATTVSTAVGFALLLFYSQRWQQYLRITPALLRPRLTEWRRISAIGLPAGSEFALTFLSTAVAYYVIRGFGAAAQAGFGLGWRILQTIVLPGIAIGFAAGPIAGQNFGARRGDRVRQTFFSAALISSAVMIAVAMPVQWRPDLLIGMFKADETTLSIAATFLKIMSWTFVAQGLVYTCGSMFQGLGNTVPALISSAVRFLTFAAPAMYFTRRGNFLLEHVWYLLLASIILQAVLSLSLLQLELNRRLAPDETLVRNGLRSSIRRCD